MPDFLQLADDAIAAERKRQIEVEGHDIIADGRYRKGELGAAGESYLNHALRPRGSDNVPPSWPWHPQHWKPRTVERDIVRGAALIVAENDQLEAGLPSRNRSEALFANSLRLGDARRALALIYRDRHEIGALAGAA